MVVQVFMSHTKLDAECCDKFDNAAARVGVKVFRSEFETLQAPAWKTIKEEIHKSSALFLLVGKELVKAQTLSGSNIESREKWKYTQNWISYEVGLACQRGIDVWVICDNVEINFPVPYLNNYEVWGIHPKIPGSLGWIKHVFNDYNIGLSYPLNRPGMPMRKCSCPYSGCKAVFNFHSQIKKNGKVLCPTCLRSMTFPDGWLLQKPPEVT